MTYAPKPRRKKRHNPLASFDIGNGFVKYTSEDQKGSYVSVVSEVSDMLEDFEGFQGGNTQIIRFEGKVIAFGDSAYYSGSNPMIIRDTSRFTTNYYKQLFASALATSLPSCLDPDGITVDVVLSLPPGRYFEREHLKELIAGSYSVDVIGADKKWHSGIYNVPVSSIRVIPEGVGSICLNVLNELGEERAGTTMHQHVVGVVDIGTLTTDLIQLDGLKIVRDGCWTEEQALYSGIYKRLKQIALNQGLNIPDYRLAKVVEDGYYMLKGQKFNIESMVTRWSTDLALTVDGIIRQHWHGGNDVEMILLTGGGAEYVYAELQRIYPHVRLSSDNRNDLVTGNSEGGYRYGLMRRNAE